MRALEKQEVLDLPNMLGTGNQDLAACCHEISKTCILLLFERAGRLNFKDQVYSSNIRRAMGLDRSTSSRCSVAHFL